MPATQPSRYFGKHSSPGSYDYSYRSKRARTGPGRVALGSINRSMARLRHPELATGFLNSAENARQRNLVMGQVTLDNQDLLAS